MWYIGVDAHKKRCFLTAKLRDGTLVHRRKFDHTPEGWRQAFADAPKGSKVAIECVGWYQPIFELLEAMDLQPVLAHARNVALIAKSRKKTDPHDADILCDLLRTDFLPTAHAPSKEARELRELTRFRDDLVKDVIRVKSRVRRLLERAWAAEPELSDMFGNEGRAWLREVKVSASQRVVLDQCLEQLGKLDELLAEVERQVARAVKDDEDVHLLLTATGVGVMGAASLRAEIDTVERFPNRKKIRSNFGMAPSVRDSADSEKRGHITKQGPGYIRKTLVQGAQHFKDVNPPTAEKYARLKAERPKGGVGIVAAAGDLLDVVYQMLKTRTPFRFANPDLVERKRRELARLAAEA